MWKVTDTEMYSYKRTTLHLTEKQVFIKHIFLMAMFMIHLYLFDFSYALWKPVIQILQDLSFSLQLKNFST